MMEIARRGKIMMLDTSGTISEYPAKRSRIEVQARKKDGSFSVHDLHVKKAESFKAIDGIERNLLADLDQFDFESEGGIWRDDWGESTSAISLWIDSMRWV